ncbi:hypothetical protein M2447_002790 [Ereboglobus sp. PH5-10]|uniref:hypothetical protein n=1 Tax=Ereboglobus sp. PH5-10 TaxID=2940629 RepID=UPI002406DA8F|nr:hypothetical protein [Ereboglobus sp. PH5-10]MDF9828662.1 hypothetical protein [Ereboglobus sp. PH5-10]
MTSLADLLGWHVNEVGLIMIGFGLGWLVSVYGWLARMVKDLIFNPHKEGDAGDF